MTGEDDTMEWKQIETSWAAMTRRIRADYLSDRIEGSRSSTRDMQGRDALAANIADRVAAWAKPPESKTSAK
ncbi:MAG: hypothetical protein EON48_07675 [Acetobacteraceae bacterium]|nr:MAG: hypothetical protein EON48_07675 [Acetobacteraceae bacterium]